MVDDFENAYKGMKGLNDDLQNNFTIPYVVMNGILNLINIIIFTRKPFKEDKIGIILILLSIFDTLQSLTLLINYTPIRNAWELNEDKSEIICKLISTEYLQLTLGLFPSWILVVLSVESAITIKSKRMKRILKKGSVQFLIFTTMSILLALVNINIIIKRKLKKENNKVLCTYDGDTVKEYLNLLIEKELKKFLILVLVPFVIMTSANVISLMVLIKSKRQRVIKKISKELKLAFITISLNVLFILEYLPTFVIAIDIGANFLNDFRTNYYNCALSIGYCNKAFLWYSLYLLYLSWNLAFIPLLFGLLQIVFYFAFNTAYRREFLSFFKIDKLK